MKPFLVTILALLYFNINIDAPVDKPLGIGQHVSFKRADVPNKAWNADLRKKKGNENHFNF